MKSNRTINNNKYNYKAKLVQTFHVLFKIMLSEKHSEFYDLESPSSKLVPSVKYKPKIPAKPVNLPSNKFLMRNAICKRNVGNDYSKSVSSTQTNTELLILSSSTPNCSKDCCGYIMPPPSIDTDIEHISSQFKPNLKISEDKKNGILPSEPRKSNTNLIAAIHEKDQYKQSSQQLELLLTQKIDRNRIKKVKDCVSSNTPTDIKNEYDCKPVLNTMYSSQFIPSELHKEIHQQMKSIQDKLSIEKRQPQFMLKTRETNRRLDKMQIRTHTNSNQSINVQVSIFLFLHVMFEINTRSNLQELFFLNVVT